MDFLKRALSLFLALVMVVGMLPSMGIQAQADDPPTLNGIGYTLSADGATSTAPTGDGGFGTSASDGRVWVDKTVTVNDSNDDFEVTLSALAQDYYLTGSGIAGMNQDPADVLLILDFSSSMVDNTIGSGDETRAKKLIDAVNTTIQTIMDANPQNRVMVYAFGSEETLWGEPSSTTGLEYTLADDYWLFLLHYHEWVTLYELLPLGHYTTTSNTYFTIGSSKVTRSSSVKKCDASGNATNDAIGGMSSATVYGNTYTQAAIARGINKMITEAKGTSETVSNRNPYVMLFTDGELVATDSDPFGDFNSTSEEFDTEVSSSSVKSSGMSVGYTILTAAYWKDKLKTAYSNADVTWFNVGLGVDDVRDADGNLKKDANIQAMNVLLMPSLVDGYVKDYSGSGKGSSSTASTLQEYAGYAIYQSTTGNSYTSYQSNYKYTDQNIYFANGDTAEDTLNQAFADLAEMVRVRSGIIQRPYTTSDGVGGGVFITFTDVLGAGMELNGGLKITLNGTEYTGTLSEGGTYTFPGLSSTATVTKDASNVTTVVWKLHAKDMPLVEFANEINPGQAGTSGKVYQDIPNPIQLSYSVKPIEAGFGDTLNLYSNAFTENDGVKTARTTATFTPNETNPYYFTAATVEEVTTYNKKASVETSVSKSANTTGTAAYVSSAAWTSAEASNKQYTVALGNNGLLTVKTATATVTTQLDGTGKILSSILESDQKLYLGKTADTAKEMTGGTDGVYTLDVIPGTYNIYYGTASAKTDTNVDLVVAYNGANSAAVNWYTVTAKVENGTVKKGGGTSDATDKTEIVLSGRPSSTFTFQANENYAFDTAALTVGSADATPVVLTRNGYAVSSVEAATTIKVTYAADQSGQDNTSDGIPDKYQAKITYTVENGTWSDSGSDPIVQWHTIETYQNGTWSKITPTPTLTAADVPSGMSRISEIYKTTGSWNLDPVGKEITGEATYTYTFPLEAQYSIGVSVTGGTCEDKTSFNCQVVANSDKTLTFVANTGYVLDTVMVDGKPAVLTSGGSYTFDNVTTNHTIAVTYAEDKYGPGETPNTPDGVPDKYQVLVTYTIVNGTWDGTNSADKVAWVNLFTCSASGAWVRVNPETSLPTPTGMQPDATHTGGGSWDTTPPADTTDFTAQSAPVYTYTFKAKITYQQPNSDPTKPEKPVEATLPLPDNTTITANLNGGTWTAPGWTPVEGKEDIFTLAVNGDVTLPIPTKTGYTFTGWTYDEGKKTFTAGWNQDVGTVNVTTYLDGNSNSLSKVTGISLPSKLYLLDAQGQRTDTSIQLEKVAGEGNYSATNVPVGTYEICDANGTKLTNSTKIVLEKNGTTSVKLNWYTVKFDLNQPAGRTVSPTSVASQIIPSGGTATKPTDPTCTDGSYQFDGWYTAKGGSTAWNFDSGITADQPNSSHTLYAGWTQDTKTVTVITRLNHKEGTGDGEGKASIDTILGAGKTFYLKRASETTYYTLSGDKNGYSATVPSSKAGIKYEIYYGTKPTNGTATADTSLGEVTVTTDGTNTATLDWYTVTATATNGTVSPASENVLKGQNSSAFTFEANSGYALDTVQLDKDAAVTYNQNTLDAAWSQVSSGSYTFTGVTAESEITVVYAEDGDGTDQNPGNKVPDKYEVQVVYKIVGGTWDGSKSDDVTEYVPRFDTDGNWSEAGTGTLSQVPTGPYTVTPTHTGTKGWDTEPAPTNGTVISKSTTYTYSFHAKITYKQSARPTEGTDSGIVNLPDGTTIKADLNGGEWDESDTNYHSSDWTAETQQYLYSHVVNGDFTMPIPKRADYIFLKWEYTEETNTFKAIWYPIATVKVTTYLNKAGASPVPTALSAITGAPANLYLSSDDGETLYPMQPNSPDNGIYTMASLPRPEDSSTITYTIYGGADEASAKSLGVTVDVTKDSIATTPATAELKWWTVTATVTNGTVNGGTAAITENIPDGQASSTFAFAAKTDGGNYVLDTVQITEGTTTAGGSLTASYSSYSFTEVTEQKKIAVAYAVDNKGKNDPPAGKTPDNTPDGVPDQYQVKITYKVENGTWSDDSTAEKTQWYTIKTYNAATGQWENASQAPKLSGIPTGMKPGTGYTNQGSWSETIANNATTVTEAKTYTYTFNQKQTYDITITVTNGTSNPVTSCTVEHGANQAITFNASTDKNYVLDTVKVDGSYVDKATLTKGTGETYTYTFSNVTVAHSIEVVYAEDSKGNNTPPTGQTPDNTPDGVPDQYQVKITYKVVNGTWSDDSTAEKTQWYTIKTYNAATGQWADASPAPTLSGIPTGMKPGTGYTNQGSWNETIANNETTVTAAKTYTYTFNQKQTYDITITVTNGTSNPVTSCTVEHGANQAITFNANTDKNYVLDTVKVDGSYVNKATLTKGTGETYTYTFSNVTATHSIEVVYAEDSKGKSDDPSQPDGVPDSHQASVTYQVVGGEWSTGGTTPIVQWYTIAKYSEGTGTWVSDPKKLTGIPTGMRPTAGYIESGSWNEEIKNNETAVTAGVTYTYTFTPAATLTINTKLDGTSVTIGTGNVGIATLYVKVGDEYKALTAGTTGVYTIAVAKSTTGTTYNIYDSQSGGTLLGTITLSANADSSETTLNWYTVTAVVQEDGTQKSNVPQVVLAGSKPTCSLAPKTQGKTFALDTVAVTVGSSTQTYTNKDDTAGSIWNEVKTKKSYAFDDDGGIQATTTITVNYGTDSKGKSDDPSQPDNIPDKYQVLVTYKIDGGTWTETVTDNADKTEYVTLTDTDGKWSEAGTGHLSSIPAVNNAQPSTGYQAPGSWGTSIPTGTLAITQETEFTFSFVPTATLTIYTKLDGNPKATTLYVEVGGSRQQATGSNGTYTIAVAKSTTGTTYNIYDSQSGGTLLGTITLSANADSSETTLNWWTVTYDQNVGTSDAVQTVTNLPASTIVLNGAKLTSPASNPARAGYTFSNWLKSNKSTQWNFDSDTVTATTTLYAGWTESSNVTISYAVKTVVNGAFSVTAGGTVTKTTESVAPATGMPSGSTASANAGYTFEGWYTNENCTEPVTAGLSGANNVTFTPQRNASNNIYETATYYAKFVAGTDTAYTVEYYLQNLSDDNYTKATDIEQAYTNQTGTTGYEVVINSAAGADQAAYTTKTIPGFQFKSEKTTWWTEADHTTEATDHKISAEGTLLIRLYFDREIYTVTLNKSEHGTITKGSDQNQDKIEIKSVRYGTNLEDLLKDVTINLPEAYKLGDPAWKLSNGAPIPAMVTASLELYAQEEQKQTTLTYDDPEPKEEPVEVGWTLIVDPAGGVWTPPSGYDWEETAPGSGVYKTTLKEVPLTINQPTKKGYEFQKWEKSEDQGTKTITLTAQWSALDVTLTIHYWYEDYSEAKPTYSGIYHTGDSYYRPNPEIEGYLPYIDGEQAAAVSGTMGTHGVTINVRYVQTTWKVTLKCVDEKGNVLHTEEYTFPKGPFQISAPEIPGYTPEQPYIEGTVEGNMESTLLYHADEEEPNQYPVTYPGPNGPQQEPFEEGETLIADLNGGKWNGNDGNGWTPEGGYIYTMTVNGPVTLKDPVREGYRFLHWVRNGNRFTAQWELIEENEPEDDVVTLSFHKNGGKKAPDDKILTPGETYRVANKTAAHDDENEVPVLFIGWTKTRHKDILKEGDKLPETNNVVRVVEDTTVYALWGYDENKNGVADVLEKYVTVTYPDENGELQQVRLPVGTEITVADNSDAPKTQILSQNMTLNNDDALFLGYQYDPETQTFTALYDLDEEPEQKQPLSRSYFTSEHINYVMGYSDGTVRPEEYVTRAEVATLFFRLLSDDVRAANLSRSNPFSDVKSTDWYNAAISTLTNLGILSGYEDGTFRPQAEITRAELAVIISRFAETQHGKTVTLTDISGHWAENDIITAASNDWVEGYTDGTFHPDQSVRRAEAVTMINRFLDRQPKDTESLKPGMKTFSDNLNGNAWYYVAIQEATNYHDYVMEVGGVYETWTELYENRDWTTYED